MAGGTARVMARLGIGAVLAGSLVIAVLHVVGPGAAISPIRRTISEYMLTSAAWAFDVGVLAIASGSVAVLLATARSGGPGEPRASSTGLVFGGLWVIGLLTLTAFPKANWALGPSISGQVHRIASLVAFVALPLAVLTLARRGTSRLRAAFARARWAAGLAVAGLAWFVPIIVAIATGASGGRWWLAVPLGLVERGMAVTEIAALVVLGVWAIRRTAPESAERTGADRVTAPALGGATGAVEPDPAPARLPAVDPATP